MVTEVVPGAEFIRSHEAVDPRSYSVTFDKIKGLLGWRPCRQIHEGIEEMYLEHNTRQR